MFGRRNDDVKTLPVASAAPVVSSRRAIPIVVADAAEDTRSALFIKNKMEVSASVVSALDASFQHLDAVAAKKDLEDVITQVLDAKGMTLTREERSNMITDIVHDVLGYGPLEPLMQRDDIADIMVNGLKETFIETGGKIIRASTPFNDVNQLMAICQRMAAQVGRNVDAASPICDARMPDGSRVNIILPPLAIDGPTITIRKFRAEKIRMKDLITFGAISKEGAELLRIISRTRCNILVSGGTGSGKTTLLNCLAEFIEPDERTVTCEDTAELQLQQAHVVRLETRTSNNEGTGEVKMASLVKNCLRMRPDRIIVGEVRGPEAFDLLQAMNTGHDGSMGTLHANSPREALARLESMVMMGQTNLPSKVIRELIKSSVNIIVQTKRLRDGTRRITHITEIVGLEDDVITTQDLLTYEIQGEGPKGMLEGQHVSSGVLQPLLMERARYFKEDANLVAALSSAPKATQK